jgi:mRNA-degrading endonuclease toxin of MazEF toxin-antitoxin module
VKRGDIYLVSLDPTQGHEQQGTRPVLIVSPDKFNIFTRVPIVVPITSGGAFARNAGFTVSLAGAGTRTTGVIRCDQPRPLDLAARDARRLEGVPAEILDDVLAKLITLFV